MVAFWNYLLEFMFKERHFFKTQDSEEGLKKLRPSDNLPINGFKSAKGGKVVYLPDCGTNDIYLQYFNHRFRFDKMKNHSKRVWKKYAAK